MRLFTKIVCVVAISMLFVGQAVADDTGVVGNWKLTKMTIGGKPNPDLPDARIELTKDGKMVSYEGDKKMESGWYEIKPGNKLIGYTDDNGNGKLDPKEKENGDELTYSRDGDTLVLKMQMLLGKDKKTEIVMTLTAVKD